MTANELNVETLSDKKFSTISCFFPIDSSLPVMLVWVISFSAIVKIEFLELFDSEEHLQHMFIEEVRKHPSIIPVRQQMYCKGYDVISYYYYCGL